ncbi:hypothetical protein PENTCL1PPCAC_12100 [Pristionchus entomophagus]|uniref:HAT C-terminal dimerisation domain-containing protein n=1 Tax=Pristionchus entomophagus TaxID=358040 RepID=A0AAV5TBZ8_9BILA|nr:hypothetical protein PENTCL1PPCAC_12100 [Pristionchus entomophagus]
MSLAMESPPEAKKLRVGADFSEVDGPSTITIDDSPETGEAQDSPAGPSSARSSNGSAPPEDDINPLQSGNLLDFISKNLFGSVFKMDQLAPMLLPDGLHSTPCSTPMAPAAPVVPGAIALANMPTAKLFSKDDWSWHRNPAASIRSGGTNKQTPVWKYFVYDKTDNLSRCIVGDCTYQLKGPHTSTLACHLKKHVAEYAEFTKLKSDYSRERAVSQMPPSPASSSSGHSTSTTSAAPPVAGVGGGCGKLTEAMLLHHNNNNHEMQQHQPQQQTEQLKELLPSQREQIERMHQAAMAAAVAANARPKSNGSVAQPLLTPPPSSHHQQHHHQQQPNPAAAMMSSPFSYLFQNQGAAAAAAASNPMFAQSLMQHGMAMGAGGQLQFTKKWRKDERKQREMEHRLSLFISSARLPSLVVNDAAFRELLELAQPRFTCPTDASQIEQVLTAQQGRLQMAVRQAIHSVRRICLMVDCVALGEKSYRVAITASVPTQVGTREQYLLALRLLELTDQDQMSSRVVETIVQQVMAENGLSSDKIVRVITNGVERDDRSTIAGAPKLIAYRPRVLAAFMHIIDSNERVQELKKRFCELLVTLISQEGLMGALINKIGGPVHLPFTETFVSILEALFPIQDSLVMVLSEAGIEILSNEDWKLAKLLLALLSVISKSVAPSHDTIDTVLPSLMQIVGILNENEEVSAGIADELRAEIENLCGSVSSPDESVMEADFLVATALNPERILLLNEEQIAYAKRELERRVQERMSRQEEAASRKRPFSCLDQLLHKVTNIQNDDGSSPSSIYPDFGRKKEPEERNRFAEAIVQAYFDEVTQSDCNFSTGSSFSNRHLPPTPFWLANTHRCPQLAEIALELLSIPASTPGVEGLFGIKAASYDPASLLQLPERLERDTLLRFNRSLVPKTL